MAGDRAGDRPPPDTSGAAAGDAAMAEDDADDGGAAAARSALHRARAAARERGQTPARGPGRPTAAAALARRRGAAGRSGAHPDARDPQLVSGALRRLVSENGWDTPLAVGGVMGRWDKVVGEEVAAHCAPETFTDGVLTVRADSSAWATQVRLLVPALMRRLAEEVGEGTVTRVTVRGPGGPSWRRGNRSVPGRGPRDTYG